MKIRIISLGCAKNLVDSEVMLGALRQQGMELTADPADADAVIVNTCSFIDASKQESINAILQADADRKKDAAQALIVTGCLSQRYSEQLKKDLPEVDAFVGLDQITQISSIVRGAIEIRKKGRENALAGEARSAGHGESNGRRSPPASFVSPRPVYIPDYNTPRYRLTPRHFAYLKIAEGCNHPCSF